jgi:RNA-directed DNA polymerase
MNSHNTTKPNGGVPVRRITEPPNPDDRLLEWILSRANIYKAWEQVKANNGAPGVDHMAVDQFAAAARKQWPGIRQSLLAGSYQPLPVKRVLIPKSSGGKRPLGIPSVLDRVIQQAIAQALGPIFDPGFSEYSYGFRPGRSAHDAVYQAREYIKAGYRWVVDMDLEKFPSIRSTTTCSCTVWPARSVTNAS